MESYGLSNLCGASLLENGACRFTVWAPLMEEVVLHLLDPDERIPLMKGEEGYFTVTVGQVHAGRNYFFEIPGEEGKELPDPASFYQPDSVHGPSQVVDHNRYQWRDHAWRGMPFRELVLYEIHVGTFTPQGTFDGIIDRLDDLAALGVNAIELMPVAQFPGERNWGYDGVFPYAVQNTYGGPDGLKRLVDACHQKGFSVFLDVVYNHLGPEGNYLPRYGPYFTNQYGTPWGDAINFDGEWSDGVREYFVNNALYWFEYFHVDGLRLDAVHMVFDNGAIHFWKLLNAKVNALREKAGRMLHMTAESDSNNPATVLDASVGGLGFRAQWLDDFHHSLYVMLDHSGRDRYVDFGSMEQLSKAYTDGFVHSGEYVQFRKRRHGSSSAGIPGDRFVVFNLNHDQVGNRPSGERLSVLVDFERLKLAAAALLLSPYVPMLFMGEEYGERAPFYYFVSHSDKELIDAVRKGRREEFKAFDGSGEFRDPQDARTFNDSKLRWQVRMEGKSAVLLEWHRKLIRLRKELPALGHFSRNDIRATTIGQSGLMLQRRATGGKNPLVAVFNFSGEEISSMTPFLAGEWVKVLDSAAQEWSEGSGRVAAPETVRTNEPLPVPAWSVVLYEARQK